ncbi:hypothetical protein [Antarctobacter jejuensis]|uniref:hypothetical protein n=1 Tax=Antarctobacter jejuensis TaxID=1439938 RepID=UPI003FCF3553
MTDRHFGEVDFSKFLEDISSCFVLHDLKRWRSRLLLPFSMVTSDGPVTLTSESDVERNFRLYMQAFDEMALDLVHREPLNIEHCPDGTVLATYRTHLMSKGLRAAPAYVSTALLQNENDGWRMSAILNARGHHQWTGRPPKNSGE